MVQMNRGGEYLERRPGTKFGTEIWTDTRGLYTDGETERQSSFFFHVAETRPTEISLRCKESKK